MKKFLCVFLALIMLFICCSCKKSSGDMFSSPDEPLLFADGQAVLTAQDFIFAESYDLAYSKLAKKRAMKTEELFISLAEQALLSVFAERYSTGADIEQIEADYELFLSDLTPDDAEYKCMQQVMTDMGIDDETFKKLFTAKTYRETCAAMLVSDIASVYTSTVVPAALEESILIEIHTIAELFEITVAFPEMEEHIFNYESVLKL